MNAPFNEDTSLFNVTNHLKRLFMIVDLFYLEYDRHDSLHSVTDCQNLSYTYFLKALPGIKAGMDIFFTAYSDRLKAFHIINASPGLEKVFNGFKSFLPAKIADRFFVHSSIDELIQILGEDATCTDFGGKGPSYSECDEYTTKLIEKHRKWFLEQDDITVNDQLRRKTNNHVEEMKGSFRKIEVD
nr:PREDICTED: uncharacterized protein LOC109038597 [Bemisia tabaci]